MNKPFQFISHLFDSVFLDKISEFERPDFRKREQSGFFFFFFSFFIFEALVTLFISFCSSFFCLFGWLLSWPLALWLLTSFPQKKCCWAGKLVLNIWWLVPELHRGRTLVNLVHRVFSTFSFLFLLGRFQAIFSFGLFLSSYWIDNHCHKGFCFPGMCFFSFSFFFFFFFFFDFRIPWPKD